MLNVGEDCQSDQDEGNHHGKDQTVLPVLLHKRGRRSDPGSDTLAPPIRSSSLQHLYSLDRVLIRFRGGAILCSLDIDSSQMAWNLGRTSDGDDVL